MCGIVGHISHNAPINRTVAEKMVASLHHRGPDGSGTYCQGNVFLGHTRLSIIDTSTAGTQPMWSKDKSIAISFNGEIYNFLDIRQRLHNSHFVSHTDTEVILEAYRSWGLARTLEQLRGMFAFVIYDQKAKKVYLVRDRVGIKPLVYYWDGNNLIFASELKALTHSPVVSKTIRPQSISDFLVYRYIPNPDTIYEDVYKLEPGHYLELDLTTFTLTNRTYWQLPAVSGTNEVSRKEALQHVAKLMDESVRYHLVADVEVGTFLSGGIDSSLISAEARERKHDIRALTIDIQPPKYSEVDYARQAAEHIGITLHAEKVGRNEFMTELDAIFAAYDEPFADSSIVPTYLLAKATRKLGIKSVLSGDGADELFYGYRWYTTFQYSSLLPSFLQKALGYYEEDPLERYRKHMFNRFTNTEVAALFNLPTPPSSSHLYHRHKGSRISADTINWIDFKTFLVDDILYKVDIANMAHGVEVRVPFLDHTLVEYVHSLPGSIIHPLGRRKHLLKSIATHSLPPSVIKRPKKGFSAPIMQWANDHVYRSLKTSVLAEKGLIKQEALDHFLENETNSGKVWQLYTFNQWARHHV
ncbi:MAG: asparagine synthase (glutamine-hydrolyzing) [Candidatus Andersenbacteria bacterium]